MLIGDDSQNKLELSNLFFFFVTIFIFILTIRLRRLLKEKGHLFGIENGHLLSEYGIKNSGIKNTFFI